jgi:hypothetical protein
MRRFLLTLAILSVATGASAITKEKQDYGQIVRPNGVLFREVTCADGGTAALSATEAASTVGGAALRNTHATQAITLCNAATCTVATAGITIPANATFPVLVPLQGGASSCMGGGANNPILEVWVGTFTP